MVPDTPAAVIAPPERRFTTTYLRGIRYGPDSVESLWDVIQDADIRPGASQNLKPKALVITGKSLSKTPVVPRIEQLLKDKGGYAATFAGIGQHAPLKDTEEALRIFKEHDANIVVGVGGGSVIDACKLLSFFHHERRGTFIPHVAIPTTLSAAEFTSTAGYTDEEGNKKSAKLEEICPKAILLDPKLTIHTPERLWLSTGLRAMDHAVETLYRPAAPYPLQQMALAAIRDLFTYLPLCMGEAGQNNIDARGKLQIAAWMSLFPSKLETGLGPSHALGHALGATYGIPHGICSVLTLPNTVRMMARLLPAQDARSMLANSFSYLPTAFVRDHMHLHGEDDNDHADTTTCLATAAALDKLIEKLNLRSSLSQYKVPREDLVKIAEKAYSATTAGPGWKEICPSAEDMVKHVLEPVF